MNEQLTNRQRDILAGIAKGHTNMRIARDLDLSEKTVKAHVTSLFKALNVTNRTEAAIIAKGGKQATHCATCTCNATEGMENGHASSMEPSSSSNL